MSFSWLAFVANVFPAGRFLRPPDRDVPRVADKGSLLAAVLKPPRGKIEREAASSSRVPMAVHAPQIKRTEIMRKVRGIVPARYETAGFQPAASRARSRVCSKVGCAEGAHDHARGRLPRRRGAT